jgi:hypothetical protein
LVLTAVLDCRYHELEAVIGAPRIRHVLQRDVIGSREERAEIFLRVATTDVLFVRANMRSIENVQVVVAVHVEDLKSEHEALEDGMCLKRDDTVEIAVVPRDDLGAVDFPICREEAVRRALAELRHVIWTRRRRRKLSLNVHFELISTCPLTCFARLR